MPPFIGRVGKAAYHRRPLAAAGAAISGSPQAQPIYTALPGTFSPTVTVRGFTRVEWCVFQVSETNNFTSDMTPVAVDAPAGATTSTTWTFTPSAAIKGARDRLVVKNTFSWPPPADAKEWVSDGAVIQLSAPAQTSGRAMADAFKSDLTVGLNINRGRAIWNDYMTTDRLRYYRGKGVTHMRIFGPWGPFLNDWPDIANGGGNWLFDCGERVMAAGQKLLIDTIDLTFPNQMGDGRIMPHIRACAREIARRNWDVTKYAVGAFQEYAGGSNAEHKPYMEEAVRTIRAELPSSLILIASATWNDPERLCGEGNNGDVNDPFVGPPDDRVLVEWHKYADEAFSLATAQYYQGMLDRFTARTGLATICGEWQRGPADGGGGIVANQTYLRWADVIHAASRGFGPNRPTFWTLEGDPDSYWRANKSGTGELHDDVAVALPSADQHIRAQSYFGASAAPSGGTTTAVAPGSALVTRLQVLNRGQSNAYFADSAGAAEMLRATMQSLAGVPVDMVSRRETADDSTLHGGTYTYWDSPYNGDPRWLAPANNDYGSAPSGWTGQDPMQHTLNAVSRHVSSDSAVPLLDLVLHWEYDLAMEDAASKAAYPNGSWEPTRRIRDRRPKAAGKQVTFRAYCPYQGGNWNAIDDIRRSWTADLANAARSIVMASGNMIDASTRDNGAHWTDESAQRNYARIGFRMARYAYDQGWLPADLSDCPSMGPRIASATRSGNSITLKIAHDKGTALEAGQDGIAWAAFTCSPGDSYDDPLDASGGAIVDATTIRLDFPSPPPTNGRVWFCTWPNYRARNLIRDNWHAIRPAKYATVPNVGIVDFPLQRTLSGVPYDVTANTGPTATTSKSFALSPQDPGTRAAGTWNTVLTVTGIPRIAWVVQNGPNGSAAFPGAYSFEGTATEVVVPADGKVPIAANLNTTDQFVLFYDVADTGFKGTSGVVTIA